MRERECVPRKADEARNVSLPHIFILQHVLLFPMMLYASTPGNFYNASLGRLRRKLESNLMKVLNYKSPLSLLKCLLVLNPFFIFFLEGIFWVMMIVVVESTFSRTILKNFNVKFIFICISTHIHSHLCFMHF